ncbi:PREDICTED: protein tesmin/TSO1-like CXC 4 isoform X2 [Tarenaya hassleriana]|uniref:protein tesmin/TSO1-like CXC 4 isoform X2 n=1 Tax=Tarenaya hassleriana TaxID=28532 RepID=UPI00053C9416|nr:PREDICTED: protein tesmin/TSO1-like CXC 4 isoform X2 [Tarenaya hassleriana]
MDTPDKNRIAAVPLCNFEDSPVFKYINDLSPIEPVKSALADNILNSFAFASPSALFTSPQINPNRESRFSIKRHRSSPDIPNPVFLLDGTVNNSRDLPEAVKSSELRGEQVKCDKFNQLDKSSETKPLKEHFSLAIELAKALKNGGDGCDIQMVSCDQISAGTENGKGSIESMTKSDEDTQPNYPTELGVDLTLFQTDERESYNGSGMTNSNSDDGGILDSEQQNQRIADPGTNSLALAPLQFSPVCHNSENVNAGGFCGVQDASGAPDITFSCSAEVIVNDSDAKTEDKEEKCFQPSRKQRSIRRRCLTFDVGGSCKKKPLRDSTNDPPTEPASVNKVPSPEMLPVPSKKDPDDIPPIPTIGLHLNGLVNTSTNQNKLICKVGRVLSLAPMTSNQILDSQISTPVSTKRVLASCDNEITEEGPEKFTDAECFDNDVLTGERKQLDGLDESVSCKRCKCRRSKCLKLYCDCFAAGLYCIEPCSCQDCFNKPIHEELVMNTRRQIEARNPLAFAPKVVTSVDSASDFRDENIKTPASARHKRGCNCKKSSCLKKYCECFLMGVGCSPSCRCVGCKNTFGHKDEQFHFPCAQEPDAVMINEEDREQDVKDPNAHHDVDHNDIGAPRKVLECPYLESERCLQVIPGEGTSEIISSSNQMLLLSSISPFPSLTSP